MIAAPIASFADGGGPVLPFMPEPDPVLELPPVETMKRLARDDPETFKAYLLDREEQIRRRDEDPFNHGWEPQIWGIVDDLLCRGKKVILIDPVDSTPHEIMGGSEVYISGGQRSSKSEFASSRVIQTMVAKNFARAWCFRETGPASIAMQQPRIYKYIPAQWKQRMRAGLCDIKYTPKNGFAGVTPCFVGPNGSQCWFKNYAQDIGTAQGEELDICWMDELVPIAWIDEIRFRLATREGKLIITFTPIDGYSPTVKALVDGAVDVLRVPAPLLPDKLNPGAVETVPRVQQAAYHDLKIVYFHIRDNPFGNPPEVENKASARGREGILVRCYGVPVKATGVMFPAFRRGVHVITQAQFKERCPNLTRKHYLDPCSGRNWAMIWAGMMPDERTIVVYREWPSPGQYVQGVGDPGQWAEPDGDKPDGKRGPAQKPWGFGMERYIEEILRAENWRDDEIRAGIIAHALRSPALKNGNADVGHRVAEAIFERDMDSRFGAAPTLTRSESKTLIESMSELGMEFEPAPGEHQREGIDQVTDLLSYNPEQPIGPDNKPKLVIVECCRNTIWALENWTGLDGQHGACKDFIDLLRYMALSPPMYLTEDSFQCRGGGSY